MIVVLGLVALIGAESAARHLFFRVNASVELAGKKRPPAGLAVSAVVQPDFLWLGTAFEVTLINNGPKPLGTGVIEFDGARCLLREIDGDGELAPGESVKIYAGLLFSNTGKFRPVPPRALPRKIVVYFDEGAFEWVVSRQG